MAKGCIFACTSKNQRECVSKGLFGTGKAYEDKALDVQKGDRLFLFNIETDLLLGTFVAKSRGAKNIDPKAWRGFYPYQVRVSKPKKVLTLRNFAKIIDALGFDWKSQMMGKKQIDVLTRLLESPAGTKNGGGGVKERHTGIQVQA